MEQYCVTGMSCAACQTRVEKAVSNVPGVKECSVSLLTNSMGVEGNVSPEAVIKAVEDAGYGATLKRNENEKSTSRNYEEELKDISITALGKLYCENGLLKTDGSIEVF